MGWHVGNSFFIKTIGHKINRPNVQVALIHNALRLSTEQISHFDLPYFQPCMAQRLRGPVWEPEDMMN
ncbi:MAG: hypothetical protein AAFY34_03335, partial [Pseudomonadota bacterium]